MKHSKVTALLATVLLTFSLATTSRAQTDPAPPPPPTKERFQEHMDKMAEELQLTPEQKTQWTDVELRFFEQRQNLHEAMRKAEKGKMDALRESQEKAVRGILTADQFTHYQKMVEAHHKQHPHPPHPPQGQ
ncbi:MAG: hypothetical protein EP344_00425 [Bacteroidetes bacterium]|nr:MAG: hypothetical protein EP344_00425 [Bacteroidota bacterium]